MAKKNEMVDSNEELLALRAKVAQLEAEKEQGTNDAYFKEIQQLRKNQTASLNEIKVKDIAERHVSLWHVSGHNIGKRVGPVHHSSAEDTFIMFEKAGIKLSLKKPTEEFIENYKQTAEYKAAAKKEELRRSRKNNSRKESEVEKLTQAIGKMTGLNKDQIVSIKSKDEVMA